MEQRAIFYMNNPLSNFVKYSFFISSSPLTFVASSPMGTYRYQATILMWFFLAMVILADNTLAPMVMKVSWVRNFQIKANTGSRRHNRWTCYVYNPVSIELYSVGNKESQDGVRI